MDESHFTFMVFCYSLCKDNGRRHLVIRGRIKELLSSPFWLTTKLFLFHHFLFSLFFLPAIISNYLEINELLLHLKKVLRVLFYPAKMWARASTVWRATICVKEERPSFFFFFPEDTDCERRQCRAAKMLGSLDVFITLYSTFPRWIVKASSFWKKIQHNLPLTNEKWELKKHPCSIQYSQRFAAPTLLTYLLTTSLWLLAYGG